jgi:hypothetical protein
VESEWCEAAFVFGGEHAFPVAAGEDVLDH